MDLKVDSNGKLRVSITLPTSAIAKDMQAVARLGIVVVVVVD